MSKANLEILENGYTYLPGKSIPVQMEYSTHDETNHGSGYVYVGVDKVSGLHMFQDSRGRLELFAKTKNAPASWYLKRGAYCYEFCRSMTAH